MTRRRAQVLAERAGEPATGRPPALDLIKATHKNIEEGLRPTNGVAEVVEAAVGDPHVSRVVRAALQFKSYRLSGKWMTDPYTQLRNTAWLVRNSRHGQALNPLALRVLVVEGERLIGAGEPLADVLEALCELLIHP